MHYWIDGYNLLFQIPLSKEPLEKKRKRLILELNNQSIELNLQTTVVFDSCSKDQNFEHRSHYQAIEIIYTTSKKTADDFILDTIESSRHPEQLCVVTSDKDLFTKAKALKANILSLKEFFSFLLKRQNKKKAKEEELHECRESPQEISRLLKIFEKKLKENLF